MSDPVVAVKRTPFYVQDRTRPDLGGNIRYGDPKSFTPTLWRYLVERFSIRSMLDVGCGEGHAVAFFQRLGVLAHGIDGLRANVDRAVVPIALHDLTVGPYYMPVDLVWSCEVAEHIEPQCVDHFVDTLANGTIVAMTHAVPGAKGYHHVNCQPAEYWVGQMAARGFEPSRFADEIRRIASDDVGPNYFMNTGLVFQRISA